MRFWLRLVVLPAWVAGCAALPSGEERAASAQKMAAARAWRTEILPTRPFAVLARYPEPPAIANPDTPAGETVLTLYIEGDGLAWLASDRPSDDPTPLNPLALKLALAQPEGPAAYLARPCQYTNDARCTRRYWTSARFAPEVLEAMNTAVEQMKQRFGAQRLVLVGYSGGAMVAALLAARRPDVLRLVTVAGNLDHQAWARHQRISPLTDSLNAADVRPQLQALSQIHFVGERDKVIPPFLVQNFARSLPLATVRVLAQQDHACCWAEAWPSLWRETLRPTPPDASDPATGEGKEGRHHAATR